PIVILVLSNVEATGARPINLAQHRRLRASLSIVRLDSTYSNARRLGFCQGLLTLRAPTQKKSVCDVLLGAKQYRPNREQP
ncbi:MAG: hypothetical protein ACREUO_11065, partial [Burkholderiales bacterium]